jgi:hypothetical protein
LDQALVKLKISDTLTRDKLIATLRDYRKQVTVEIKTYTDKWTDLHRKLTTEPDEDKKTSLRRRLSQLTLASDVERYKAAKFTIRDILSAEQFAKLDDLARAAGTDLAMAMFNGVTAAWPDKGVNVTPEQDGKIDAVRARLKEDLAKLDAGARGDAIGLAMKATWNIRKTILTPSQARMLSPRPTSQPAKAPA